MVMMHLPLVYLMGNFMLDLQRQILKQPTEESTRRCTTVHGPPGVSKSHRTLKAASPPSPSGSIKNLPDAVSAPEDTHTSVQCLGLTERTAEGEEIPNADLSDTATDDDGDTLKWHLSTNGDDAFTIGLLDGCCSFVCMQNGVVFHFGSNSRDELKRKEYPDHLEATPLDLPDDDDDTPAEKRRKLRLRIDK